MSNQMDTIWSKLDRKATAIAEFTMRQYRTRISTWAVMGAGLMAILLMLLFYIDAMGTDIDPIDNDGDSFDSDGDGYPDGQERKYGTNPTNPNSFPSGVEPDDPSVWIDEDDFNWANLNGQNMSVGYDDDGDCLQKDTSSQRDANDNGIECDVYLEWNVWTQSYEIQSDGGVDEDPDDNAYLKEAGHRAFVLGIGKFGIVYLLGIFLPLFLATGLIREEMSDGTLHYMLAKPIARGEILLYRMVGYLGIVWPYIIGLCTFLAVVTGFIGPSDGFFRWSDLGVWLSIAWAAMLVSFVYGMIFCSFGILWKNGVILAIIFATWELGMAFVALLSGGDSPIKFFSVIGWGLTLVDAGVALSWPDNWNLIEMGLWGGGNGDYYSWSGRWNYNALPGAEPLAVFSGKSGLNMANWAAFVTATMVLLVQGIVAWFIGQTLFKGKEVD